MKNTRGTFRNIHPNFLVGGRGDGDDNTKATREMSKCSLCESRTRHYITRPGVFFRGQCSPELRGEGGLRTRGERAQQPSIKISETGYFLATEACFSCREACVTRFYPARYTRRRHKTRKRRGGGWWARARVGRLTEIVPSWTLSPSIYSSLVVDFVRFIEACPRIFQREHCHDPGLTRGASTRIHPGGEILISWRK